MLAKKPQKQVKSGRSVKEKAIIVFLATALIARIAFLIFGSGKDFFSPYWPSYPNLEKLFNGSQYRVKNPAGWIPDETIYAYAAGAYVKGANPILIESTQPPLGKYILAASIVIFNNTGVAIVAFYVLFLIGVGLLTFQLSKSLIISLILTIAITFEPLIKSQLDYTPLLDIFQITFLVWALFFARIGNAKRKARYIIVSLLITGLAMMTKVLAVGGLMYAVIIIYTFIKNPRMYKAIIVGTIGIFVIFFLTYFRIYSDGFGLIDVLKTQKWLLWYHRSKINHFGSIWPLIFFNMWSSWWGEGGVTKDANWSMSWGITIIISIIFIIWKVKTKQTDKYLLLFFWIIAYSILISVGQASSRYLLPLLPFTYIASGLAVKDFFKKIIRKRES